MTRIQEQLDARFPSFFTFPRSDRVHVTVLRSKSAVRPIHPLPEPPPSVARDLERLPAAVLDWSQIVACSDGAIRAWPLTPDLFPAESGLSFAARQLSQRYGCATRVQSDVWLTLANVKPAVSARASEARHRDVSELLTAASLPYLRVVSLALVYYHDLAFASVFRIREYPLRG